MLILIHTDGTKTGQPISLNKVRLDTGTYNLWLNQGFINHQGQLEQYSEDLASSFRSFGQVEVLQEIRPDSAIKSMQSSDILIGAKSSFSFVAGLARGDRPVIYSNFWHKLPENWTSVGERINRAKIIEKLEKQLLSRG
jgi:hypothetical protein